MADISEPPPISALLREPLRALLRGGPAHWPREASANDAANLLEALDQHGVAPLLYALLSEAKETWPISASLRDTAIHAAAGETSRLGDLRALLDAFAARGIRVLIIKGTGLAYDIYERPELRPRGDTDLLIDANDCDVMRALMHELGYESQLTSGDTLAVRQQSFRRSGHVYDVHWDVTNSAVVRDALPFAELLSRAILVPRIGAHAWALSHTDALLLACLHRVAHHHDNERLIWLYDLHLLRERMSRDEHAAFWRLAAERRLVAICERSIALSEEWFGSASHDRASDWLHGDERVRHEPSAAFLDRSRSRAAVLGHEIKALGWLLRLRRVRELTFPPPAFIRQSFPAAPRVALPALYLWRSARGVMRLFRRVRE
jgi:hypothetical protein